jgi:glycosyltransferase involved in cell wall biosynthesis
MYRMEQWSMALADVVLAPLEGVGRQYAVTYGIDPRRVRVCLPPMEALLAEIGSPQPRRGDANEILYWGKLHPVKGVETFVEGCLGIAESRPDLRFVLVGPDTNDAPDGKSMREYLEALIPEDRKDRFRFEQFLPRSMLASRAAGALCAVVPSKSESFCLVAHELARAGCPLVLTDIPAFEAFEEGRDALHFDGSSAELAVALDRVARDPALRERLAGAGARMRYAAPGPSYAALPPPSRTTRDIANFARREVESLAALSETERDLQGVLCSKAWRLVTAGRDIRDRVRDATSGMAKLLGRRSPVS